MVTDTSLGIVSSKFMPRKDWREEERGEENIAHCSGKKPLFLAETWNQVLIILLSILL